MRRSTQLVAIVSLLGCLNFPALAQHVSESAASVQLDVSPSQLAVQQAGNNWLSYNGDYTGRRYSTLDQITPLNVSKLQAQWVFHAANSDSLEVTPVVVDGMMFVTSANDAYALDAKTGRLVWYLSLIHI